VIYIGGPIVILVLAAGAALFFYQNRQIERVSAQKAETEFRDLRARFGDQPAREPRSIPASINFGTYSVK
jgi:hypothetical protein